MGFLADILAELQPVVDEDGYLSGLPAAGPAHKPSLREAINARAQEGAILAEFKRVSPGQATPILPGRAVEEFVRSAEQAHVAGFSCLATGPRFEGSPSVVREVASATSRPVLFKDFVVSERQVAAAARSGASAVLLIARLAEVGVPGPRLAGLARSAHDLGLEVVLEFHAEAELSQVDVVPADVYGVNVRDLDSLRIDRPTAETTIERAREIGLRPLIGLSGVESPAEAGRFWDLGVDGILVGTAVARSREPTRFLRSLGRPVGRSSP